MKWTNYDRFTNEKWRFTRLLKCQGLNTGSRMDIHRFKDGNALNRCISMREPLFFPYFFGQKGENTLRILSGKKKMKTQKKSGFWV